jgi:phosphatidylglycerophosphate synthase
MVVSVMADDKMRHGLGFPWANTLSLSRLLLALLCGGAILENRWPTALLFFAIAIATDLIDGPVARRRGQVSPTGGFLDHVSDATFVSVCLATIAFLGLVPGLLPALVVLAFIQYALDSRVLQGHALRASALGRYNGIAYFVVLGIPVVRNGLGLTFPSDGVVWILAWGVVLSTVVSMLERLVVYMRVKGSRE